jgi:hypothetical protein
MIKSRTMRWAGHIAKMERRETYIGCWLETHRERDHWENQDVDGRIILRWALETHDEGVDWISLAQDRGKWRAFVSAVISLWVP